MRPSERAFDRGSRQGERLLHVVGDELQGQRLASGLSQEQVATAAHLSRSTLSRIETGKRHATSVMEISRVAAVLGLDLAVRLYPGGEPLRDSAQLGRMRTLVADLGPPLRYRTEVPLPPSPGRLELRAWDGVIEGRAMRTTVEVEMGIRDAQALERRLGLKRRDDPADRFLMVVADTRTNRRVLADHPELFPDLPRLARTAVLAALRGGMHPATGVVLL
jgi:transcriptional regulator with XRE-family HTH domain